MPYLNKQCGTVAVPSHQQSPPLQLAAEDGPLSLPPPGPHPATGRRGPVSPGAGGPSASWGRGRCRWGPGTLGPGTAPSHPHAPGQWPQAAPAQRWLPRAASPWAGHLSTAPSRASCWRVPMGSPMSQSRCPGPARCSLKQRVTRRWCPVPWAQGLDHMSWATCP